MVKMSAWMTAAMMRTKRLPSLKSFLRKQAARVLSGKEKERRQKEFDEMSTSMSPIIERLKAKQEAIGVNDSGRKKRRRAGKRGS